MEQALPCIVLLLSTFICCGHGQVGRSVVILQPSWSPLYKGERVTLKCEIEGRGNTDWIYEWKTTSWSTDKPVNQSEYTINEVTWFQGGVYRCQGRPKNDTQSSTGWSDAVTLTVLNSYKPSPVLSVSPRWLSPGASVTLSCSEDKQSPAGWRFYWWRSVAYSYSSELLPGSLHGGTAEGSYIIHPTGTGSYQCKAARGGPNHTHYSDFSEPRQVFSGDGHSSASLTVSPDTTQHFINESVSLTCEGKNTSWIVQSFTEGEYRQKTQCYSEHSVPTTRFTCDVSSNTPLGKVLWCEYEQGEYSNAVNITVHDGSVILVSPASPVTEGHSVTLKCKHRTDSSLSNVDFYRNDQLVQTGTNGQMIIPAVSVSDEGFYKCTYSGEESPQSWMAVTVSQPGTTVSPGSSGSPPPSVTLPVEPSSLNVVGQIVGLLGVILLAILAFLLCRYTSCKDLLCAILFAADQRTNEGSDDPDDTV